MKFNIRTVVVDLSQDSLIQNNQQHPKDIVSDIVKRYGATQALKNVSFQKATKMRKSRLKKKQEKEEINGLIDTIVRYVKTNDKYTQLTSILLKSYLYYMHDDDVYNHNCDEDDLNHHNEQNTIPSSPIVVLPRTEAGRPYIILNQIESTTPASSINNHPKSLVKKLLHMHKRKDKQKDTDETSEEALTLPFNISHQYPFVVLSYIHCDDLLSNLSSISSRDDMPLIGMDVVTFDERNPNIFKTTKEFVQVFRESFTSREWSKIMGNNELDENTNLTRNDDQMLREFYLRWAMKEAYSKALGLGLSLDFSSFESQLIGFDVAKDTQITDDSKSKSSELFDYILHRNHNGEHVIHFPSYTIHHTDYGKVDKINWEFHFMPIYNDNVGPHTTSCNVNIDPVGCICVCVGTADPNQVTAEFTSSFMSVQDLCDFHAHEENLVKEISVKL